MHLSEIGKQSNMAGQDYFRSDALARGVFRANGAKVVHLDKWSRE